MPSLPLDHFRRRLSIPLRARWLPLLWTTDAARVDPREQHRELRRVERHTDRIRRNVGQPKAAALEPLVVEDEPAVIPAQYLHAVAATSDEDEEVPGEDILLPLVTDDRHQTVDAATHVCWFRREENPDRARQAEHRRSPQRRDELGDVAALRPDREAKPQTGGKRELDDSLSACILARRLEARLRS